MLSVYLESWAAGPTAGQCGQNARKGFYAILQQGIRLLQDHIVDRRTSCWLSDAVSRPHVARNGPRSRWQTRCRVCTNSCLGHLSKLKVKVYICCMRTEDTGESVHAQGMSGKVFPYCPTAELCRCWLDRSSPGASAVNRKSSKRR